MSSRSPRHGLYVEHVLEDTLRYSSELLQENERLRLALAASEQETARQGEEADRLRRELARLGEREQSLRRALGRVQADNQHFSERYREIEQENSNLANLYVASYRLHGTLDRAEVLQVLQEITANLIGSEEVAIFEVDASGALALISSTGVDADAYRTIAVGEGPIGACAKSGERWVREGEAAADAPPLSACVPLKLDDRVIGAIALFRLLPQKPSFAPVDLELFDLLATHAATALYCSRKGTP